MPSGFDHTLASYRSIQNAVAPVPIIPTRLSAKQKTLLRELEACCSEQHNPRSTGFLKKARRFWNEVTGSEAQA